MTGYTRQSTANIVAGQQVTATPLANEFNAIEDAFDGSTGHPHDGTVGGGPRIGLTTAVTGVLPIANGGTNSATIVGANNNLNAIGANIAAAATVDLSTATGNYISVTGAGGPITSFGTVNAGAEYVLVFTGAPTVTHNATSLIIPGGANVVMGAGDVMRVRSLGSGNWKVVAIQDASLALNDPTLVALAAYNTNGLLTQTAADTFAGRTITGTAAEITVTNGDGGIGNPTISIPSAVTLTGKTLTNGTFVTPVFTTTANPSSNDGAALGTGAASWSDLFLASGGILNFNNGNYTITHSAGNLQFSGTTSYAGNQRPASDDGASLGISGTAFSDLFLASGGVINWNAGNYTLTHSAGLLTTSGVVAFGGAARPSSNDGAALGVSGTAWADLFLASGGVIDWVAGDVTITHSSNLLTFASASNGYIFDTQVMAGSTVGTQTINSTTHPFQAQSTSGDKGISLQSYSTTASESGTLAFYRSKSGTVGTATVVASGDSLGKIDFVGAQQTGTFGTQNVAARIQTLVDGVVTSGAGGDMPGRIVFSTTGDDTGTLVERMRLTSAGVLDMSQGTAFGIKFPASSNSSDNRTFDGYTDWIAYTPTFTGFGVAASISFWSRRVGDTLHIRGKFTAGTPTAVEGRITLGYNGSDGGVTSDATKVPSIMLAGSLVRNLNGAAAYYTLIESGVGYLTFSAQAGASNGLTKINGDALVGAGNIISLMAEVPISGW